MAKLVSLCLENQMDLPLYRLSSEEVCLFLCAGRLLDEHMERLFHSFDGYIETRLQGSPPTEEQKRCLLLISPSGPTRTLATQSC